MIQMMFTGRVASLLRVAMALMVLVLAATHSAAAVAGQAAEPASGASGAPGSASGLAAETGADEGANLWRAGDRTGALRFWMDTLSSGDDLTPRERARLAYNVGVAHHSDGMPLLATAWFETALRLAPRWDAARANRDLSRADAGLDPKDTGIVGSFVQRFTRGEAEWLAMLGAALIVVLGALDAFRGGAWARGPWLAILALPILWAPLVGQIATGGGKVAMVVAADGVALYGTPDRGGERLGKFAAGDETYLLDELPGWVKVVDRGEERWIEEDSVLSLRL